jgi:heterodisulfide reductase subunit A-like polyferredoxin
MNAEAVEAVNGKRALVIGGGIAGIQAALDLADARIPAYESSGLRPWMPVGIL